MGDDGQEKTEQSTAKHRLDARRQGTVARSRDLTNATVIIALLLMLPLAASMMGQGALSSMRSSMSSVPSDVSLGLALRFGANAFGPVLPGLSLVLATVVVVGLAANLGQVGFVFSAKALQPNFAKLNPLQGIKRLLSASSAFEAAKAFGKAVLLAVIAYVSIKGNWDRIGSLDQIRPQASLSEVGILLRIIGIRVAFAWAALAAIDYYFQRKQIDKQLRMTKDAVRREMREAEMAPELKMARARNRRRLMRQRLKEAVRSADVVVTNPTHFAVALKYQPGKNHAPMVVAKGADFLAARIREEAAEARIPLVPNPPLARALYKQCEVGDFVPRELFQAVAEVLAYVYRTLRKMPK